MLASSLEYPTYLRPILGGPSAYIATLAVPGLAWTAMLNLSASPREVPAYHHYIGAMGVGVTVVMSALFILHVGITSLSQLLILLFVPMIAFLATGPIAFSIAYWSPDFVVNTRIMGSFVIFGWLVNGISTVTNFVMTGAEGHSAFSFYIRDIVVTLAPQGLAGVEPTLLWVWVFLLANMAIGIHVATQLAPYANTDAQTVHAMQGVVGLVGFSLGLNSLFHLVGA